MSPGKALVSQHLEERLAVAPGRGRLTVEWRGASERRRMPGAAAAEDLSSFSRLLEVLPGRWRENVLLQVVRKNWIGGYARSGLAPRLSQWRCSEAGVHLVVWARGVAVGSCYGEQGVRLWRGGEEAPERVRDDGLDDDAPGDELGLEGEDPWRRGEGLASGEGLETRAWRQGHGDEGLAAAGLAATRAWRQGPGDEGGCRGLGESEGESESSE